MVNQIENHVNMTEKDVNMTTHIRISLLTKKMLDILAEEFNLSIDKLVNQLIIDKRFENYKIRMENRSD